MQIIKRFKDSSGKSVQYLLDHDGVLEVYPALAVVNLYNDLQITNAILLPNGEFKAREGYHIDTDVYTPQLIAQRPTNKPTTQFAGKCVPADYYGKACIKACKKIRYCALTDNITVDMTQHKANSGRNTHLFKLIQACGISVHDFVIGYLSEMQPYALTPYSAFDTKDNIWVCELGYKTSMLIKLQNVNGQKPLVLSFHESNLAGRGRTQQIDFTKKPCAVIVDTVKQVAGKFVVDYTIRKGFLRYAMQSVTDMYSNGIAYVNYNDIKQYLHIVLQDRLQELSVQYYSTHEDFLPELTHEQNVHADNLSFLSYGFSTVNTMSMLVDLFSVNTNKVQRLLLTDLAEQVFAEATPIRQAEIVVGLREKFGDSNALVRVLVANALTNTQVAKELPEMYRETKQAK